MKILKTCLAFGLSLVSIASPAIAQTDDEISKEYYSDIMTVSLQLCSLELSAIAMDATSQQRQKLDEEMGQIVRNAFPHIFNDKVEQEVKDIVIDHLSLGVAVCVATYENYR